MKYIIMIIVLFLSCMIKHDSNYDLNYDLSEYEKYDKKVKQEKSKKYFEVL